MKTKSLFLQGAERYMFDSGMCSVSKGFAQVDTRQDAPYFGLWANAKTLQIVCFCEGDLSIGKAEGRAGFVHKLRVIAEREDFIGIDPGWFGELTADFEALGLGDLLR